MKVVCLWGPSFCAIWDHLEEFLRCGDLKLRCVRFGETAWHVFCDSGVQCKTAMHIAAICDARCETAKLLSAMDAVPTSKFGSCLGAALDLGSLNLVFLETALAANLITVWKPFRGVELTGTGWGRNAYFGR